MYTQNNEWPLRNLYIKLKKKKVFTEETNNSPLGYII